MERRATCSPEAALRLLHRMSRLSQLIVIAVAPWLYSACSAERTRADTARADSTAPSMSTAVPDSAWVVTPRGIGPLRVGMTRGEVEAVLGATVAAPGDSSWRQCAFVSPPGLPAGVRLMVEGGTIARLDVDSGRAATAAGARVGDSEAHIRDLYTTRVASAPLKYGSGHTLTVISAAPADSTFRLVFETDGRRVTRYRAGRMPEVEYVEGCG
jgi:hypothetical protein